MQDIVYHRVLYIFIYFLSPEQYGIVMRTLVCSLRYAKRNVELGMLQFMYLLESQWQYLRLLPTPPVCSKMNPSGANQCSS